MSYSNKLAVKPFSERYTEYYKRCFYNRFNVLEGAYRAGKSVINIFAFANYIDYCEDKIHLATGATQGTARLNISDCNGLGLKYIFRGRCTSGKYEGLECLKIKSKNGEKIVIFAGGNQSDSYKKIQGLSFGSWISVELANLYISDDEKNFIDMAISRLTQSKLQRIFWDLNPVYPSHKVYTKYLDKYEQEVSEGKNFGGYNYMKCSLFDNTALSDVEKQMYVNLYPDHDSLEYQRYILGNRFAAEGLIFRYFAIHPDRWIITDVDNFLKGIKKQFISIGIDFGGNGSDTTFVASLIYNNFSGVLVLYSDKLIMKGGESTVKDFDRVCRAFIEKVLHCGIASCNYIFADNADTVMVNEVRSIVKRLHMANQIRVLGSTKHEINDRIKCKQKMMLNSNYFISSEAETVIDSSKNQVWDDREGHEEERLDNGTVDIDTADAEEYSWSNFLDKLVVAQNREIKK